jgi:hypothetical protein
MKTKTGLTRIAATIVVLTQLMAAVPEIPSNIQVLARDALQQVGYWDRMAGRAEPDDRISIFNADLDKLAELMNEDVGGRLASMEGNSMEAKIATLAYQRKLHRDLFDEIESTYCALPKDYNSRRFIFKASGELSGVRAPEVKGKHLTPAYRHALEYCLLKYENYYVKQDNSGYRLDLFDGEVHCATAIKRQLPSADWWTLFP